MGKRAVVVFWVVRRQSRSAYADCMMQVGDLSWLRMRDRDQEAIRYSRVLVLCGSR